MSDPKTPSVAEELCARLIAEWSMDKVRILHQGSLWWCWDGGGYTRDMAQAGLYEADWKPDRDSDEVMPVDPKLYPIDALMLAMKGARAEGRASVVAVIRGRIDSYEDVGGFSAEVQELEELLEQLGEGG